MLPYASPTYFLRSPATFRIVGTGAYINSKMIQP